MLAVAGAMVLVWLINFAYFLPLFIMEACR
jgi:hypothetical protein